MARAHIGCRGEHMSEDPRVKLKGHMGPIVVQEDFPLEAVLKHLGVPYQIVDVEEQARQWEHFQQLQKDRPDLFEIGEIAPMEIPKGILDFLDHSFSTQGKKNEKDEK